VQTPLSEDYYNFWASTIDFNILDATAVKYFGMAGEYSQQIQWLSSTFANRPVAVLAIM
jgi:hypothetical protein